MRVEFVGPARYPFSFLCRRVGAARKLEGIDDKEDFATSKHCSGTNKS